MKYIYIKSVVFICATLLFCACEPQQVDDIVNNVQRISGPSCCTTSKDVSWNGSVVTLYQQGSKISFICKVSGTLSFYYEVDWTSQNKLKIQKNNDVVFNDYSFDRTKIVINNVQVGDKFSFTHPYGGTDDILVDNIIITAGNGNNSNNSDNPGFDF